MCIVDETHRLLNKEDQYEKICKISRKVDNILLFVCYAYTTKENGIFIIVEIIGSGKIQQYAGRGI